MRSSNIKRVFTTLAANYGPFNRLAPERLTEIEEIARFIELRSGELFQICFGNTRDYLFVVEGAVEIIFNGGLVSIVDANERQRFTLPAKPGCCTLLAMGGALVCQVDREMLDRLVSWEELVQMHEEDTDPEMYWRLHMVRNSMALRGLPLEHVETAFKRMAFKQLKAGQEIILCGAEADTFYILTAGKAEIWQPDFYTGSLRLVDEVTVGGNFGKEALISGYKYSVTVRMVEDGAVLALKQTDFQSIVGKHLVRTVNVKIAKSMLESGYRLLDVRYEEEFLEHHIPGAKLIPLVELRKRITELDPNSKYVVCCHSGSRSAVAAMILTQHHIESVSLEGGLRDWHFHPVGESIGEPV